MLNFEVVSSTASSLVEGIVETMKTYCNESGCLWIVARNARKKSCKSQAQGHEGELECDRWYDA